MASTLLFAFMASILFSLTMGHSQMRCAKYDITTGNCEAPIRNEEVSYEGEAYDMTSGNGICQSPMTNPISASYSNGTGCPAYAGCPLPMGTFTPGETFNVMWFARNHATPDQTPGNISLYLSPPESQTQGSDATEAQFEQNHFCEAPFSSCDGQNGNLVQCYTSCTMPSNTAAGIYTIWWKWAWPGHTEIYSTCADIYVVSGSNSPAPISTPSPTPSTPLTTSIVKPITTSVAAVPISTPTPVIAPVPTPVSVSTSTSTSTSSSSTSSESCSGNSMKCLSGTSYSMCNRGSWGAAQFCGSNTMCSPSGDYIYCIAASSSPVSVPTPTPVIAPVPVSPTVPSTSTSSTSTSTSTSSASVSPIASGSCTLGYQTCVGTNQYQTCGNGRNGPEWASPQSCQVGLSCHASSTANNIYCY